MRTEARVRTGTDHSQSDLQSILPGQRRMTPDEQIDIRQWGQHRSRISRPAQGPLQRVTGFDRDGKILDGGQVELGEKRSKRFGNAAPYRTPMGRLQDQG